MKSSLLLSPDQTEPSNKASGVSLCVCVCVLTPAELAHRVSRFGQTPKQHLLPVGVGRPCQLKLWVSEDRKWHHRGRCKEREEKTARGRRNVWQILIFKHVWTHRCRRPPPLCRRHPQSSEDRWRTEPTWNADSTSEPQLVCQLRLRKAAICVV